MPTTAEFLRHVLPETGYYCAAIQVDGVFHHRWVTSIDALAAGLLGADALHHTVYHACASYQTPTHRRGSNVKTLRSFWADLDCGSGKPYATQMEAASAAVGFCERAKLPVPVFVSSGFGVHLYWVLAVELDSALWLRYAAGLRELCARLGLLVDRKRSCDIASILRPVGTHNFKHEPFPIVACGSLVGPYPLDAFKELLDVDIPVPSVQIKSAPNSVCAALAGGDTGPPPDADLIARGCAQFRKFTEKRSLGGEPMWRAAAALASYTRQGSALAHELSKHDPKYDADTCQRKIDYWREHSAGPPTCAEFFQHDAETCRSCPHFETLHSPISLGYQREAASNFGSADPTGASDGEPVSAKPELLESQIVELPYGYKWGSNGELFLAGEKSGGPVDYLVSSNSIYLDSVQLGEVTRDFMYVFQQHLPNEGWRDILVEASTMHSPGAFASLHRQGANIADKPAFLEYTRKAVDLWNYRNPLKMTYEQYGWKDNNTKFLFGDTLYTAEGREQVSGSRELRTRAQWVGPAPGYTLADWQVRANALFASGCEPQAVAVLAGFAAPLMKFLSDEGGVIIAFITPESAKGKTTALIGMTSPWGRKKGLEIKKEFSTIVHGLTLSSIGNLPLIFDEMRARDPKALRDWVKMFTEGGDKVRASRDGHLKHTMTEWQTIVATADNHSLIELLAMTESEVDEPATLRVIELPCYIPKDAKDRFGDKLKSELDAMSGYAGEAYLDWLVQPANLDWTKKKLEEAYHAVYKSTGWDERHRFWVRGIATIAVAGLIVRDLGIINFEVSRIVKWLINECQERIYPKTENDRINDAINVLAEFIDSHISERLSVDGPFRPQRRNVITHRPLGHNVSIRYEAEGRQFIISKSSLRAWCLKEGHHFLRMLKYLTELGVITDKHARLTLTAGTDIDSPQKWCIVLDGRHPLMHPANPANLTLVPQSVSAGGGAPPPQS